jgi:hypothetical protein
MSLTDFQRRICRLLAENRIRSGESYVAGGAALNEILRSPRQSQDLDLFHDTDEALEASWDSDRDLLRREGYAIEVLRERPALVEAKVTASRWYYRQRIEVAIAYATFLLLVRLWLRAARAAMEREGSDFEAPEPEGGLRPPERMEKGEKTPWSLGFDILSDFLDILDLKALLLLGILILGIAGLIAVVVVVLSAPVLLAEVLLGGVLSAGLYRRLRASPGESWLGAAVRRTWKPFLLALIFFAAAGIVLQALAPGAVSIGGAWKAIFR